MPFSNITRTTGKIDNIAEAHLIVREVLIAGGITINIDNGLDMNMGKGIIMDMDINMNDNKN